MLINEIKEAIRSMVFKRANKRDCDQDTLLHYLDHSMLMWQYSPTVQDFIQTLKSEIEDQGIDMFCRLQKMREDARRCAIRLPQISKHSYLGEVHHG